jgi:hypothetical protein
MGKNPKPKTAEHCWDKGHQTQKNQTQKNKANITHT